MSRSYAVALIILGTAILGSLVWLHFYLVEEKLTSYEQNTDEVHKNVIEQKLAFLDFLAQQQQDRLDDPAKEKYRPILPAMEFIREQEVAFFKQLGKLDKLLVTGSSRQAIKDAISVTEDMHQDARVEIMANTAELLANFGDSFGYSEEEIETLMNFFRKESVRSEFQFSPNGSVKEWQLAARYMALSFLNFETAVFESISELSGGKIIRCFFGPQHFPIVRNQFLTAKRGREKKMEIGFGDYSTELNPEDLQVVIGVDTLSVKDSGFATYSFIPKRRGVDSLNMELLSRNPLTGEPVRSYSTYTYYVH